MNYQTGVDMNFKFKIMMSVVPLLFLQLQAQPIIRSIHNKTPFEFTIVSHNDLSDCSPFGKGKAITIQQYETFKQRLLLGAEKPGLMLRPSAFYDRVHKITYSFLDGHGQIDKNKLIRNVSDINCINPTPQLFKKVAEQILKDGK